MKLKRRLLRYLIWLSCTVVVIIAAYGTLLAFPEPLFAHKYSYKNFVIYSRTPVDDRIKPELDVVSERLAKSELNDPSIVHRVFVTGSSIWYAFFNGPYRGAMARNYEFHNSIFVPQLDLTSGNVVHFSNISQIAPKNAHLSQVSNQMNRVMQRLSVVATIFLPITFITGVFGMNFAVQPWLNTSVWFWLFMMACVVAVIYWWLRHRHWVGQ